MRLIDANALITTMQNYYEYSGRLCDELANIIGNAPTVETEPVKHGKWIEGDMLECNQCHHRMIVGDGAYNFCPNCGAKMDKG